MSISQPQVLIFDADDTLWENNIYFEDGFARFVEFLDHEHLSSTEIQVLLDQLEAVNVQSHGYGARSFARSLRDTFQHITGVDDDHPDLVRAEGLGLAVLDAPFDLMEGVADTLTSLAEEHVLYMLTKGHAEEQQAKIDRSGLAARFQQTIITSQKTAVTYRELQGSLGFAASETWMIGNSPRSDINPALSAGLNAVLIPHDHTWHHEVEALDLSTAEGRRFVTVSTIRDLPALFLDGIDHR